MIFQIVFCFFTTIFCQTYYPNNAGIANANTRSVEANNNNI